MGVGYPEGGVGGHPTGMLSCWIPNFDLKNLR